jgi:hypothetical protein
MVASKDEEFKFRCTALFKERVREAASRDGITVTAWVTQALTQRLSALPTQITHVRHDSPKPEKHYRKAKN